MIGCGGATADHQHHLDAVYQVVGSDAGSNHHFFRAANYRVLDTLLGRSKLSRAAPWRSWKVVKLVVRVRRCAGARGSGPLAEHRSIGSIADSMHHFRAVAIHRILDTPSLSDLISEAFETRVVCYCMSAEG